MESDTRPPVTEYDRRNVTGGGPYQVELAARLRDVRFPRLCARCGGVPTGTLAVRKMFVRHHDERPDTVLYPQAHVPFCQACIDLHHAEVRAPDPAVLRRLRNRWIVRTLPYWIPIGVILFMLRELSPPALDAFAGGEPMERLVWAGVLGFFALCLLLFVRLVLVARHHLVADYRGDASDQYIEHARGPLGIRCIIPGPPTGTLRTVDFSDEEVELFGTNHRTFTFTNLDVATAFAAENADLVWDPNSPAAVRARWATKAVVGAVLLVGLVLWLRELLGF